jgi:hypothetical protein
LAVKRNPKLRDLLFSRHIWRRSHLLVAVAVLGVCAAAILSALTPPLVTAIAWLVALGLFAPYVRYRAAVDPLPATGPRRRWLLLPAAFALDCCEVLACLVGSARHRTFVL